VGKKKYKYQKIFLVPFL